MATRRCSRCGLTQLEAAACKRCGADLVAPQLSPRSRFPAPPGPPMLSFWTRPRETIAAVVRGDPDRSAIGLAWFAGTAEMMTNAALSDDKDPAWRLFRVGLAFIMGPLAGFARIYLGGIVLGWTGRWLGGTAGPPECRAVLAWASLPPTAAALPFILGFLVLHPPSHLFTLGASLLFASGLAWGAVALVKTLSEVHGFSSWRAVAALLLAGFVAATTIIVIVFGVGYVLGVRP